MLAQHSQSPPPALSCLHMRAHTLLWRWKRKLIPSFKSSRTKSKPLTLQVVKVHPGSSLGFLSFCAACSHRVFCPDFLYLLYCRFFVCISELFYVTVISHVNKVFFIRFLRKTDQGLLVNGSCKKACIHLCSAVSEHSVTAVLVKYENTNQVKPIKVPNTTHNEKQDYILSF